MENKQINLELNLREWFARDYWYRDQAACIFALINPDKNRGFDIHHNIYLKNKVAQKYLEIIDTWSYGFNRLVEASPFWYINKAMEVQLTNFPEIILLEVKNHFEHCLPLKQSKFLQDYPYIARNLQLAHRDKELSKATVVESSALENSSQLSEEDDEIESARDRNDRLCRRAVELFVEELKTKKKEDIIMNQIYEKIMEENPNVSIPTLKHNVKRRDIIKLVIKKRESDKVN